MKPYKQEVRVYVYKTFDLNKDGHISLSSQWIQKQIQNIQAIHYMVIQVFKCYDN